MNGDVGVHPLFVKYLCSCYVMKGMVAGDDDIM